MSVHHAAHKRFANLLPILEQGLPERHTALRLCVCAALAGESVFLYGPPGTAKSLLARRLQCAFGQAKVFDYLLSRFSTPEELFGPLSIASLRDADRYERRYSGYLPDADIVFLDEIWKAGPPIQNALLTALNEKIWRNGDQEIHLPLKCLVGASNELASDDSSQAFWDRFLLRIPLEPLRERQNFAAMISDTKDCMVDPVPDNLKITAVEWETWQNALHAIPLAPELVEYLWQLRSRLPLALASSGPSDRRWKKIIGILKASAFMHGRDFIAAADLALLPYCLWNDASQWSLVREICADSLSKQWFSETESLNILQQKALTLKLQRRAKNSSQEPLIVDEEYYLIDAPAIGGAGNELRIWINDFKELLSQTSDIDLFIYRNGSLVKSIVLALSQGKQKWTVRCAGLEYALCFTKHELDTSLESAPISPSSSNGQAENDLTSLREGFEAEVLKRQQAELQIRSGYFCETIELSRCFGPLDARLATIAEILSLAADEKP